MADPTDAGQCRPQRTSRNSSIPLSEQNRKRPDNAAVLEGKKLKTKPSEETRGKNQAKLKQRRKKLIAKITTDTFSYGKALLLGAQSRRDGIVVKNPFRALSYSRSSGDDGSRGS